MTQTHNHRPGLWWATVFLSAFVLFSTGCSKSHEQWNGKDITGLMPNLEFNLIDETGNNVTAADSAGKVRLLFFGFTSCPDVCPVTLSVLGNAIKQMPPELQEDVTALFVSVDPERDTLERISSYVAFFSDHIAGMTGEEPALRKLAKRYRTTFGYEEPDDLGNYEVSHSAAVYVFDGSGSVRLLFRPNLTAEMISKDLTALVREQKS
jgi:protein SCO1/2